MAASDRDGNQVTIPSYQSFFVLSLRSAPAPRSAAPPPPLLAETAINIGYSCQLLTDDLQDVFVVEGHTLQDVEAELNKCLDELNRPTADAKANQHKQSLSVVTFR